MSTTNSERSYDEESIISFGSIPELPDVPGLSGHPQEFVITSPGTSASLRSPASASMRSPSLTSPGGSSVARTSSAFVTPVSLHRSASTKSSVRSSASKVSSIASSTSSGNILDRFLREAVRPKRKYESSKRPLKYKEDTYLNPKRQKLISDEDIMKALRSECCVFRCMESFTVEQLSTCRERFVQCTRVETNKSLMTLIETGLHGRVEKEGRQMYILPTGNWVCDKACALACGVSAKTFSRRKVEVMKGMNNWVQLPHSKPRGIWQPVVVAWVEHLAETYGNHLPHKEKTELAVGNKNQIYNKFYVEHEASPDFAHVKMLSLSYFYRLWPDHVTTPKENSFTKCDICKKFKTNLAQTAPHSQRVTWVKEFDEHLEHQMLERKQYYRNREHARSHPDEAISIIIDGASQGLHTLPFFGKNPPKALFGLPGYDLHVMGALVHHYGPRIFLHDKSTETGPNNTIEVLYRTLCELPVDKLPRLLYLQLDNTPSDNKNHHVLEFCTWLVDAGVFEEVPKNMHSKYFDSLFPHTPPLFF